MVQREALDAEVGRAGGRPGGPRGRDGQPCVAAIEKQEAEIDAELGVEEAARAALVPTIPDGDAARSTSRSGPATGGSAPPGWWA